MCDRIGCTHFPKLTDMDFSGRAVSSRRSFLKKTAVTAVASGFPTIMPSSLFGQYAPSKRINVGAIGVGRISRGHDLPGIWQFDGARIMAVCDLDASRVAAGCSAGTNGRPCLSGSARLRICRGAIRQ